MPDELFRCLCAKESEEDPEPVRETSKGGGGRTGDCRADLRGVFLRLCSASGGKETLSFSDIVLLLVGRTKIPEKIFL